MMNPSLHPLAFALLLTIHGAAVAVPTVSTPIPKAVLAVQQTLEAKTSRLGEALEQAAEALDNCNAELPDGHQPDPAHSSRYLECRQTALGETQRVYDKLVNAFDDFAGDIGKIRKQIDSAITYNQRMIEQYQKKQRKVALALKKSRARARAVADSLPAEGRPSRKQLNEMRRLASDILSPGRGIPPEPRTATRHPGGDIKALQAAPLAAAQGGIRAAHRRDAEGHRRWPMQRIRTDQGNRHGP